eukprot:7874603-Pyramimonas_sp.AAC.1
MCTEERRSREDLYEGPGGNLVDGLRPFPVRAGTHGSDSGSASAAPQGSFPENLRERCPRKLSALCLVEL